MSHDVTNVRFRLQAALISKSMSKPQLTRPIQDAKEWLGIAASSSTNEDSFSSACTMKRFPSPRCASTIQTLELRAAFVEIISAQS
jgi:hypothetical protein